MKEAKRVLIVTYYWPPAGGVAVQRVSQFAKYLHEFGWQPVILTVSDGNYSVFDPDLEKELSHLKHVVKAKSIEPHRSNASSVQKKQGAGSLKKKSRVGLLLNRMLLRFLDFVRLNVFVPDSRIGWYPFASRKGADLIRSEPFDAIFSTAPPYTCHLVARKLSQSFNIPWIADFRDPWYENTMYNSAYRFPWVKSWTRKLERDVLNDAHLVLCTGWKLSENYQKKIEGDASKFKVITNGFVDNGCRLVASQNKFIMTYFGSLYRQRCDPSFFELLGGMIRAGELPREHLLLRFIGEVDGHSEQVLRRLIPDDVCEFCGFLPKVEAQKKLQESALCLMTIDRVELNETIILGKLYDYIQLGIPVLGIGPENGDSARLLNEYGRGKVIDYDNPDGQRSFLIEHFKRWINGDSVQEWRAPESLSRYALTKELSKLLDQVVS